MRMVDLIFKKKNNKVLTKQEIDFIIAGYTNGQIPDYQMSALMMAIYFNGMNDEEITSLTEAMKTSGDVIDLSDLEGIKVDKHSTGGVGDKTSIALGPILAALDLKVAKMSGRGLGFTGGTLDKLESIPGYKVGLSMDVFKKQVANIGLAIIGQTPKMVPADKMMYSLRDVTSTVDSLPLIASSIMSKKLATGSDVMLLDVKVGNGAFMATLEDAKNLGNELLKIGKRAGKKISIELTSMDRPLGKAIGNKNEILEAVDTLQGKGPEDFKEVVYSSVSKLLMLTEKSKSKEESYKMIDEVINSGKALEKFKQWIKAQEGDVDYVFKSDFWNPKFKHEVKSDSDGFMKINSSVLFGLAAMKLGAGRETKEDDIDFEAGIQITKKSGDAVSKGDVLFTLYSSKEIKAEVIDSLVDAYEITNKKENFKVLLGEIN